MTAIPSALRNSLIALGIATGTGGGAYIATEVKRDMLNTEYLAAVAADLDTSEAVKIAMVMANYYESSNRHIGKPYIDKNGKGRPLTVCNGITGAVATINPSHFYTPAECYAMEKRLYIGYEQTAPRMLNHWSSYGPYQQATFLDFIHHKGPGALSGSTMRRLANSGDIVGACNQNPRWNKGTVNGVLTVLPGMDTRGKSNAELCLLDGLQ